MIIKVDSGLNTNANRIYHDYVANKYELDPRVRLGTMHPNSAKRLKWLRNKYFSDKVNIKVLNIGVGTGALIKSSDEIFGHTFNLDISGNMLRKAKRYTGKLIQANAVELPIKQNSMDLIFSIAVLHHIYDLKNFFKSVCSVLKDGGIFYSDYDPNKNFYNTIEKLPLCKFIIYIYKKISDTFIFTKNDNKMRQMHDIAEYHEEFLSGLCPQEVADIAKEAGFSEVKYICHSDAPNLDLPRKGRLAHKVFELLLLPFSGAYTKRAKIFCIIAVK